MHSLITLFSIIRLPIRLLIHLRIRRTLRLDIYISPVHIRPISLWIRNNKWRWLFHTHWWWQ